MYAYATVALIFNLVLCIGVLFPYILPWLWEIYNHFWTLEWIQLVSPIRLLLLWWRDVIGGFLTSVLCAQGMQFALLTVSSFVALFLVLGMAIPYCLLCRKCDGIREPA